MKTIITVSRIACGSSTVNRDHVHHLTIRASSAAEHRPRWTRRRPSRRQHAAGEQFVNGTAVIGDTRRNGRSSCYLRVSTDCTWQPQAALVGAEVVNSAHHVDQKRKRMRMAQQDACPSRQHCHARPKGGVESFDKCRVALCDILAVDDQFLGGLQQTPVHPVLHTHHPFAVICCDNLPDQHIRPQDQPEATSSPRQGIAEWATNVPNMRDQDIHAEQQWPSQGLNAHDADQMRNQPLVSAEGDNATQSQTHPHNDRHCQPAHLTMHCDPALIRTLLPIYDHSFVQFEDRHNRLNWTAIRYQIDHHREQRGRMSQPIEWLTPACHKRLPAYRAAVALLFAAVHDDSSFTDLTPVQTGYSVAALFSRVHVILPWEFTPLNGPRDPHLFKFHD